MSKLLPARPAAAPPPTEEDRRLVLRRVVGPAAPTQPGTPIALTPATPVVPGIAWLSAGEARIVATSPFSGAPNTGAVVLTRPYVHDPTGGSYMEIAWQADGTRNFVVDCHFDTKLQVSHMARIFSPDQLNKLSSGTEDAALSQHYLFAIPKPKAACIIVLVLQESGDEAETPDGGGTFYGCVITPY